MTTERLSFLYHRLREDNITQEESVELRAYMAEDADAQKRLSDLLETEWNEYKIPEQTFVEYKHEEMWAKILESRKDEIENGAVVRMPWLRTAVAAVFILVLAGGGYLFLNKQNSTVVTAQYKGNVAPGREGSKLKLSDGRVVLTDTIKDGFIAMDGSVKIVKRNGRIVYEGQTSETIYNEIIADKGRQTSAVLPDGSVVYLNAASSLKYPLHFSGNERLVEMTGEVFFEVVHNQKQPFRVKAAGQIIEDIGTTFNVNAYNDEKAMVTTLVEGSIKIADKILKPRQEWSEGKIQEADVDRAIAWHKGLFSFEHADIQTVMRQFTKWYDVDVKFEGTIPDETFSGKMERNLSLMDALDNLKQLHVKFRLEEDKRIVVLP